MGFNHRKSITYRLAQAGKAHRQRAATHLGRIGLHPGQEQVLKALAENDGLTMGELAVTLKVQPPTITKMISRLGAQQLVDRRASSKDARQVRVFLTDHGAEQLQAIDKSWRRLEKEALNGLDDKDRRKLRKLLRRVEHNLSTRGLAGEAPDTEEDAPLEEDLTDSGPNDQPQPDTTSA